MISLQKDAATSSEPDLSRQLPPNVCMRPAKIRSALSCDNTGIMALPMQEVAPVMMALWLVSMSMHSSVINSEVYHSPISATSGFPGLSIGCNLLNQSIIQLALFWWLICFGFAQ